MVELCRHGGGLYTSVGVSYAGAGDGDGGGLETGVRGS